jgi:hypothetical protein
MMATMKALRWVLPLLVGGGMQANIASLVDVLLNMNEVVVRMPD